MKKVLGLTLSLILSLSVFTACNTTNGGNTSTGNSESSSVVQTQPTYYTILFRQYGQEDKAFLVKEGENFASSKIPAPAAKSGYVVEWDLDGVDFTNVQ